MRHDRSLPPDYFEHMFRDDPDPWGLESSAYEAEKHARTVQMLGVRRFEQALEIGCAGGMLTQRLAPLCEALLAVDVSETALKRAEARCADLKQVRFARMAFPDDRPDDLEFDLIVLSEVVYYWTPDDVDRAAHAVDSLLGSGGYVLLAHWIGETDYPLSGDDAVAQLRSGLGHAVTDVQAERRPQYRLDLWRRL